MPQPLSIIADPDQAATLLQPLRRQVLAELAAPGSATSVAKALGQPRQKVNYHIRELEKAGLIAHVEDRRRGNCTERIVQASARAYLLSPAVLGRLERAPEAVTDRFSSAFLMATAARTIEELARLRERAARVGKTLPTLTLQAEMTFVSPAEQQAFADELAACLARLARKYHAGASRAGRQFKCLTYAYPAPGETDE